MYSKPFYTPIFERGWVEQNKKEVAKELRKGELVYEAFKDDENYFDLVEVIEIDN